ncbi:hypothetical protein GCM10007063_25300 [Lentibacillus kapialis]|uniref:Atypical membrane-integrating protein (Mistic protein) n=1 Tax=Lentibacillus kapialis TaxID=340214 RepID=A0A917Q027_9BACI|nr:hypothetical protein [Lentibacillus kapialis]GGK01991.1 hypothetical protein GCM10007063_25300 [Lentibacillus kapialis]
MKASEVETKRFDKALDDILDLFNNLESDKPVIQFEADVLDKIERAKMKYGGDNIDKKMNAVVHEMLSWLDLDDMPSDDDETSAGEEGS